MRALDEALTHSGSLADVSAADRALASDRRVGLDTERDDGRVLGCSDSYVVAASHECALSEPNRFIADLDGTFEGVQIGVPARSRRERGRGAGVEAAVVKVDVVAGVEWGVSSLRTEQMPPLAGDSVGDRLVLDIGFEVEAVRPYEYLEHP